MISEVRLGQDILIWVFDFANLSLCPTVQLTPLQWPEGIIVVHSICTKKKLNLIGPNYLKEILSADSGC